MLFSIMAIPRLRGMTRGCCDCELPVWGEMVDRKINLLHESHQFRTHGCVISGSWEGNQQYFVCSCCLSQEWFFLVQSKKKTWNFINISSSSSFKTCTEKELNRSNRLHGLISLTFLHHFLSFAKYCIPVNFLHKIQKAPNHQLLQDWQPTDILWTNL